MRLAIVFSAALLALSPLAMASNTNPTGQSRNDAGAGGNVTPGGQSKESGAAAGQDGMPSPTPPSGEKPSGDRDKGKASGDN
ncbi:hypothetical protein Msil_3346 [Methylocella silvestris BL2]|uniref:Lipoprotein n=1 Tax=Methylocella silvestris (strain DSM 15510 / CIP 108128 / LMG 27833 / NCIMB 13906 / BL2) TaxID=395965 RepID=B8ES37_METSB|nr:hypothetical protein [Methylocella silvestris]ACK52252.1 hypothetical protein Msil_3346 [Methylocella silvestris BL2]